MDTIGRITALSSIDNDKADKTNNTDTTDGLFNREIEWREFEKLVRDHVLNYTIKQYGDSPDDQISEWSAQECVLAIRKRCSRFGKGQREGTDALDLLKMAHEACVAYYKLKEQEGV